MQSDNAQRDEKKSAGDQAQRDPAERAGRGAAALAPRSLAVFLPQCRRAVVAPQE